MGLDDHPGDGMIDLACKVPAEERLHGDRFRDEPISVDHATRGESNDVC